MYTAFQPNAFQPNAFQIGKAIASRGAGAMNFKREEEVVDYFDDEIEAILLCVI